MLHLSIGGGGRGRRRVLGDDRGRHLHHPSPAATASSSPAAPTPQPHDGGDRAASRPAYCHGKGGSMPHRRPWRSAIWAPMPSSAAAFPRWSAPGSSPGAGGTGTVSIAFFGDGAMQQGILYESMNMAALWDLPVVFVCINNQVGHGHPHRPGDQGHGPARAGPRLRAQRRDRGWGRRAGGEGRGAPHRRCRPHWQAGLPGHRLLPVLRPRQKGQEPLPHRGGGGRGPQAGSGGPSPAPPSWSRGIPRTSWAPVDDAAAAEMDANHRLHRRVGPTAARQHVPRRLRRPASRSPSRCARASTAFSAPRSEP